MACFKGMPSAGEIKLLMETVPDFLQRLEKRLILESCKLAHPVKFIGRLISKGVLCDGPDESEGSFGLKETIVQLALSLVCSKDASAICGLMASLEESGNSDLVSSLRTWIKEDFGIEINATLGEPKGDDSNVQTLTSEMVANPTKNSKKLSSSGTRLIDKIMSRLEDDFMEQLEGYLVDQASEIVNVPEFCSSLALEKVLDVAGIQLTTGLEVQSGQLAEKAIRAACSKRTIGSLVLALQSSSNEHILAETNEWLESSQARKKNYPIAVKSLANKRSQDESLRVRSTFFEQPALPDGLPTLTTFKCQQKSATKGTIDVQFDMERMVACDIDGTLNLWNWRENKEESIQIAVNAKNITCFQLDEEILVLGTADGTVHLFDLKTFEEKSLVKLSDEPIISLKFVQSTVGVITGGVDQVWWIHISLPNMRLLNQRCLKNWSSGKNRFLGVHMFPDVSFVCSPSHADVYETKSGKTTKDGTKRPCYLVAAAADMRTLNVDNICSKKRVAVAGCPNGEIVMWNTSKLSFDQKPVKTFRGQGKAILSLCFLNGHLVGLDQSGKLLMWSGHEIGKKKTIPAPKILLEKSTSTHLAAHERWFATGSSEDEIISMWTVPTWWLRTGGYDKV